MLVLCLGNRVDELLHVQRAPLMPDIPDLALQIIAIYASTKPSADWFSRINNDRHSSRSAPEPNTVEYIKIQTFRPGSRAAFAAVIGFKGCFECVECPNARCRQRADHVANLVSRETNAAFPCVALFLRAILRKIPNITNFLILTNSLAVRAVNVRCFADKHIPADRLHRERCQWFTNVPRIKHRL